MKQIQDKTLHCIMFFSLLVAFICSAVLFVKHFSMKVVGTRNRIHFINVWQFAMLLAILVDEFLVLRG